MTLGGYKCKCKCHCYSLVSSSLNAHILHKLKEMIVLTHNHNIQKNYVHHPEAYDYKKAITNGNIDVNEVEKLFPSTETLLGHNLTNVISTPVTIYYYYAIGDLSPAYVIDKGKRIHVRKESNSLSVNVGYGLNSLPTDVACWRIAYSFTTILAYPMNFSMSGWTNYSMLHVHG